MHFDNGYRNAQWLQHQGQRVGEEKVLTIAVTATVTSVAVGPVGAVTSHDTQ